VGRGETGAEAVKRMSVTEQTYLRTRATFLEVAFLVSKMSLLAESRSRSA